MSSILLWLFGAYAVGTTLALLWVMLGRRQEDPVLVEALKAAQDAAQPVERLKALAELAKIRKEQVPWWERSVSTIGIVALLSSLLANGVQTINGSLQETKVSQLRLELNTLEKRRTDLEQVVGDIATLLAGNVRQGRRLDEAGTRILRYRLESIGSKPASSPDDLRTQYEIALVLGDFQTAVELLERNLRLLDETRPTDRVTLAEYYYLVNAHDRSSGLIKQLEAVVSSLPRDAKLRVLYLKAAASGKADESVSEVAGILNVGRDDARRRIQREMEVLRAAASRNARGK